MAWNFNANGTDNYLDLNIVPIKSSDWYWEICLKSNDIANYQYVGCDYLYYDFNFGIKYNSIVFNYLGNSIINSLYSIDVSEFNVYKITGDGKLTVNGISEGTLSSPYNFNPVISKIYMFALNKYSSKTYSDVSCLYSKIVNNGTAIQEIYFDESSGNTVTDDITSGTLTIQGTVLDSQWQGISQIIKSKYNQMIFIKDTIKGIYNQYIFIKDTIKSKFDHRSPYSSWDNVEENISSWTEVDKNISSWTEVDENETEWR